VIIADDPDDIHHFEKNVLYLFDFMQDKLIIGKFCQIASGVRFIMNGSNHAMEGISTYPFKVFGKDWSSESVVSKGDTVIGHDVWLGNSATIMQGILTLVMVPLLVAMPYSLRMSTLIQ